MIWENVFDRDKYGSCYEESACYWFSGKFNCWKREKAEKWMETNFIFRTTYRLEVNIQSAQDGLVLFFVQAVKDTRVSKGNFFIKSC